MEEGHNRKASSEEDWRSGRDGLLLLEKVQPDPEKANRLAASLKPRKKLNPMDIVFQTIALQTADEIDRKYDQLVKEGKYPQAEVSP